MLDQSIGINPFATGDAYMRQLFHCLQWYAGSERVDQASFFKVIRKVFHTLSSIVLPSFPDSFYHPHPVWWCDVELKPWILAILLWTFNLSVAFRNHLQFLHSSKILMTNKQKWSHSMKHDFWFQQLCFIFRFFDLTLLVSFAMVVVVRK